MQDYLVTVTPKSGTTPASAVVEERTVVQAIGDTFSAMLSDTKASVGYTKTGVQLSLNYGVALLTKYRQTGAFSWNPL